MSTDRAKTGLDNRRRVLGADYVDEVLGRSDDFDREFQQLVTEYCWGTVWAGSALTDKQRSLNNLCLMAAMNRPAEFRLHLSGALRNGCTREEIRETLIQIAVYVGIPAGVDAFRLARSVFDEAH